MTKYHLKGLDCANCANEIETELRKNKGLEFATVNFATKTLALDADSEELARSIIVNLEPAVELLRADTVAAHEEEGPEREPIVRIITSAVLLAVGTIFGRQLREMPGSFAEYIVFLPAYFLVGYPVLKGAWANLRRGRIFNEMFLMAIATIGAIALGQLAEAVGVMLFYSVGEYLQELAVARSRSSISRLMNLRPEFARVIADGEGRIVDPEAVSVGDFVEVRPGERIPLDGEVVEGYSFVDTSSLTGESLPASIGVGDKVKAGYVNDSGRFLIKVSLSFGQSSAARILDLVENAAASKAPTERFMTRIAAVYTPFVVISAVLIAFLPPLFVPGASLATWASRALVLLVISCPCALVISIPLGYFGGVGSASRNKILVKGANHLDALLKVDTVVFDKTGTLTKGSFEVVEVAAAKGFSRGEVLSFAAAAERLSPHPIARAIRRAGSAGTAGDSKTGGGDYSGDGGGEFDTISSEILEVKGKGVSAIVGGHRVLAGNEGFLAENGVAVEQSSCAGTVVYLAVDGCYAGRILVADAVKDEAASTVRELRALGVRRVVMLSGDRESAVKEIAASIGVDEYFAGLLPENKVERLDALKVSTPAGKNVVFVGDGMNDAPVLMRADVGIAMGGLGSDAAIEAADVVIMDDHIGRVPVAMKIAAFTRRIVMENVIFALGVKATFLLLGTSGEANMWEAVIADVGVTLLATLNSIRAAKFDTPVSRR